MGIVRVFDSYSAGQVPNPTGPPLGERIIGAAVKGLGEMLAGEFVLPDGKGKIYSNYRQSIASPLGRGRGYYADIQFKSHWYSLPKTFFSVLGRDWEDSISIDARFPALLVRIEKVADKFVTLPGAPDVNIFAIGPGFPSGPEFRLSAPHPYS